MLKLGGSLLTLPDLRERFRAVLERYQPPNAIVVGGGSIIEGVRELDQLHGLEPAFVHWLCVDLLGSTASLAAQVLELPLIDSAQDLAAWKSTPLTRENCVVHVTSFYSPNPNPGDRESEAPQLPQGWETTSDSIAGLLAYQLEAQELLLLKSTDPPTGDLQAWANAGFVDPVLPIIAPQIPKIKVENLRSFAHE